MQYPGQIRVTVIRETRSTEIANSWNCRGFMLARGRAEGITTLQLLSRLF